MILTLYNVFSWLLLFIIFEICAQSFLVINLYKSLNKISDFINKKIKRKNGIEPTIKDWETHLTTVFPEVRLKSFIE